MENSSRNRILGNFFVIYRKTEKIRHFIDFMEENKYTKLAVQPGC